MPTLIAQPTVIAAAGNKPKRIEEYAGRVNSGHQSVSVARMVSPAGWVEPGQRPEFEEVTVVLRGVLHVEHEHGTLQVRAGQAHGDTVSGNGSARFPRNAHGSPPMQTRPPMPRLLFRPPGPPPRAPARRNPRAPERRG